MSYQVTFDNDEQHEMPAFLIERFACLPCNDNNNDNASLGSTEHGDFSSDIDVSFSSRGSAFSYLSAGTTSPMARALERIGNEVVVTAVEQQEQLLLQTPRRHQRNNNSNSKKQTRKSRRKHGRSQQQPQPVAPSTQPCRFFRSKKGCSRPNCPFVHC